MSEGAIETVRGKHATVSFDSRLCIHARHCVISQPGVFKANVAGAWIDPDAARAEELVFVAMNCPSGAIQTKRHDGGADERPPKVNAITVREDGPLAVSATMTLAGKEIGMRATLCRCGQSKSKPYCDGSHVGAAFQATGEPATKPSEPMAERAGVLAITPYPNGPLGVSGNVEILSGTGRTIDRVQATALCRCGQSGHKPYCDGSHKAAGFVAP
jgi:CDGSH-type Zn-finger protein/uncharacterized Fe-S cluster protein YjdI